MALALHPLEQIVNVHWVDFDDGLLIWGLTGAPVYNLRFLKKPKKPDHGDPWQIDFTSPVDLPTNTHIIGTTHPTSSITVIDQTLSFDSGVAVALFDYRAFAKVVEYATTPASPFATQFYDKTGTAIPKIPPSTSKGKVIATDGEGTVIATNAWVRKFDSTGSQLWELDVDASVINKNDDGDLVTVDRKEMAKWKVSDGSKINVIRDYYSEFGFVEAVSRDGKVIVEAGTSPDDSNSHGFKIFDKDGTTVLGAVAPASTLGQRIFGPTFYGNDLIFAWRTEQTVGFFTTNPDPDTGAFHTIQTTTEKWFLLAYDTGASKVFEQEWANVMRTQDILQNTHSPARVVTLAATGYATGNIRVNAFYPDSPT